jgi:GNAT superfamily N-acetyltransferase
VATVPSASESYRTVPRARAAADRQAVRGPVRRHPLHGGLRLRPVTVADRDALVRTVDRSSAATREARFHEALPALPLGWARRMCQPAPDRVVVAAVVEGAGHALSDDGAVSLGAPFDDEIVGLAQVEPDFGGAELTVFVEDAYHRRGIGGVLVRAALAEAAGLGIRTVKAHVLPDNDPIHRLLTALDLPLRQGHDDGKVCWTVDITGLARS